MDRLTGRQTAARHAAWATSWGGVPYANDVVAKDSVEPPCGGHSRHLEGDEMLRLLFALSLTLPVVLACGGESEPSYEIVRVTTHDSLPVEYPFGGTSVEEKVANSDVIVRATMTSFAAEVAGDADGAHRIIYKFHLAVSEYLQGTGGTNNVAVWIEHGSHGTIAEADRAKANLLTARDGQWDDREAIIFLSSDNSGYGATIDALLDTADHYLLAEQHWHGDDRYSLHSEFDKLWLPSATPPGGVSGASAAESSGDSKAFLLAIPKEVTERKISGQGSGSTPTITQGALKSKIAAVQAAVDAGDGSEAYRECIQGKYRIERLNAYHEARDGTDAFGRTPVRHELESGEAAGTVLETLFNDGVSETIRGRTWLEGADADLFTITLGERMPFESGETGFYWSETLATARPLPSATYTFTVREVWTLYAKCDFAVDLDWTVVASKPEYVTHEAFFDPVDVGGGVQANAKDGVLKPRTFTGGTLNSISYGGNTVTIGVTPDTALDGRIVDFIATDGTVSLSLEVSDATVNATDDTLSWTVADAPWADGDELMVRVRSETH